MTANMEDVRKIMGLVKKGPETRNKIEISNGIVRIFEDSSKHEGKVILIDEDDLGVVLLYKWTIRSGGSTNLYAMSMPRKNAPEKFFLHRLLMNFPDSSIDHINGNGLDNRRSNLRLCTTGQNNMNSRARRGSTSKYKGVSWHKPGNKWIVRTQCEGKEVHIGSYGSELEAAKAYDKAAYESQGKFARLNRNEFPGDFEGHSSHAERSETVSTAYQASDEGTDIDILRNGPCRAFEALVD